MIFISIQTLVCDNNYTDLSKKKTYNETFKSYFRNLTKQIHNAMSVRGGRRAIMAALLGCPSGRSTMRLILFLRSPPWRPGGYLREARAARMASPVAPVAKRESPWP